MRVLVLCEGKTDAILISYLLSKLSGWYVTKSEKDMKILTDEKDNESSYWYTRSNNDKMLICGVGGKDKFSSFFIDKIKPIILQYPNEKRFDRIVIIHDKDFDNLDVLEEKISNMFNPIVTKVKNDTWITNKYIDGFGVEGNVDVLGLIIPRDNEGALESVLLNSMQEQDPTKTIVQKSLDFVDQIKPQAQSFIPNYRMELKAKLGVSFAILSPQKVFSYIDILIKSVDWEKSETIKSLFDKIINL